MLRFTFFLMLTCATLVAKADSRLFHISRSLNANIVCYDARIVNGKLDANSPVHVYWHNNTDRPGAEDELSVLQRKMAYGYKVVSRTANEVEIKLTAYNKRSMKLRKLNGRWACVMKINGKDCILNEIYVKARENNSLRVEYVLLKGKCIADGTAMKEKIDNN